MYSTLETAYNDNTSELDKMAKAINKKKDNLFKSEEGEFDRVSKKWSKDIKSYNNYINYKDSPDNINNNLNNLDHLASSKEDYASYNNINYNGESNNNYTNLDDISIDSISVDSPTLDSYIESIKSDKTKSKSMHKIIEDLNSEDCSKDSEDIYEHIKKCKECKMKLLKYITSKHHNMKNKKTDYYEDIYKKRKSLFNYFGEIENKEIFIIILLGIFMIIILDFMMKGVKNKL
jgi:hypothetical protein